MLEMKTGMDLDSRLCELLEPGYANTTIQFSDTSPEILYVSPLGFWLWGDTDWHPALVSTDWGVMGKAVEMLSADYDIKIELTPREYPKKAFVQFSRRGHPAGQDTFGWGTIAPAAFTLAAIEALEQRAKEKK